jgi:hypothetical protein
MLLPCGLVAVEAARAAGLACELHGHGTDVDLVLALPGPLRRRVARTLLTADRLTFPSAEKLARFARALELDPVPAHCQVETMVSTLEADLAHARRAHDPTHPRRPVPRPLSSNRRASTTCSPPRP